MAFIDHHRAGLGVEPICQQLPIAPSTYYEQKARAADPERVPARAKRDRVLCGEIRRVWEEQYRVYGARKVWRQLQREGHAVARCTVERLMQQLELQGVRRGAKRRTTVSNGALPHPADRVNRQFTATRPNQLWVADITYVGDLVGFDLYRVCGGCVCPAHRGLAGSAGPCARIWSWMPWSRRCGHGTGPTG